MTTEMMNKEFSYKGIVITREDYESMPCPSARIYRCSNGTNISIIHYE